MFRIDSVICSVFTSGIMCVTIPPVKAAYSKKAAEWRDHIVNAEVLAFVLYFVLMLAIGFYFFLASKKNSSEKEYFLGGRAMGPWVTAMSAQASDMSAWLLMGLPGSILAFGLGQAWIGIGLAIGTSLNWIIVAKRLRKA